MGWKRFRGRKPCVAPRCKSCQRGRGRATLVINFRGAASSSGVLKDARTCSQNHSVIRSIRTRLPSCAFRRSRTRPVSDGRRHASSCGTHFEISCRRACTKRASSPPEYAVAVLVVLSWAPPHVPLASLAWGALARSLARQVERASLRECANERGR